MTTYAVDCETRGEAEIAQMIAFKKGYVWSGRQKALLPLKNRRIFIFPEGHMLHGNSGQQYGPHRIKTLNLSELNKLGER